MSSLWQSITNEAELNSLLSGNGTAPGTYFLILKHSSRCAISAIAKNRLERKADPRISYFLIDVIHHRQISNALAEASGVQHESPQAFLYNGTTVVDVKSHMGISAGELSKRLDSLIQIQK